MRGNRLQDEIGVFPLQDPGLIFPSLCSPGQREWPDLFHDSLTHVAYFQGSVDDLPELLNIIKKESIDTIFHLGGMLSMSSEQKLWASFQANVVGTLRFDEEKARSEWGWKASYSLPEMVDDFIREFDENPLLFR